jgi:hypothetical protein
MQQNVFALFRPRRRPDRDGHHASADRSLHLSQRDPAADEQGRAGAREPDRLPVVLGLLFLCFLLLVVVVEAARL